MDYFNEEEFPLIEFVAANFNPNTTVPDICIRQAYCYKTTLKRGRSADDYTYLDYEITDIIEAS